MAENINTVTITGNLTADPELRQTNSGTNVCSLRVAVNARRKDGNGEWVDKPNFFNVVVFGGRAASCAEHLAKGRPIAVSGRLDWSEWTDKESGQKRNKVEILADNVQFLGTGQGNPNTNSAPPPAAQAPAPAAEGAGQVDDSDIPF